MYNYVQCTYFGFSDADSKAWIYTARYQMLQQRTSRHKLFSNNTAVAAAGGSDENEAAGNNFSWRGIS